MSEYEFLKAQYDRMKAKQDGRIAIVALRKLRDEMRTKRDNIADLKPPVPSYSTGYRDGWSDAVAFVEKTIMALEQPGTNQS